MTLELADGTLVAALLDQGWFSIRADITDGMDIFDQRIIVNDEPTDADAATEVIAPDRSTMQWFTDGDNGLFDDSGTPFAPPDDNFAPTAARLPNGDIYFIRKRATHGAPPRRCSGRAG